MVNCFLPQDAMLAQHMRRRVCLSVCLSQISILLKQLNVGSHKQCCTITQGL